MSRSTPEAVGAAWASVRLRRIGRRLAMALSCRPRQPRSPCPTERLRRLAEFGSCFEELVEVLCDAARFGCVPSVEERYRLVRARALATYPPLQPLLGAYLPAEPPVRRFGGGADAFERLFLPSSVADVLAGDGGELIETVQRGRVAIAGYARHLRALMGKP